MSSSVAQRAGSRKRRKMAHDSSASVEENIDVIHTTSVTNEPTIEKPVVAGHEEQGCEHKKELGALHADLESMRDLITCRICQRFLAEPYGLTCGHTYCYICLDTWLVAQKKNTCPECRAVISEQPVPSLIIRDMVGIFSSRIQLLPEGETLEDLAVNAKEGADMVAKDKAAAPDGKPFKGIFSAGFGRRRALKQAVFDADDNIHRCPDCFHEVEDGTCSGCGERLNTGADSFDEDDLDLDDFDHEDIFGLHDYSDSATGRNAIPWRPSDLQRAARRGGLFSRVSGRTRIGRSMASISSVSSDSEDDDEHDPEMDSFVVPDDDGEEGSNNSDSESESEGQGEHERWVYRANRVLSDSEDSEEDDEYDEPVRSTNARSQRSQPHQARSTTQRQPARAQVAFEVLSSGDDDDEPVAQRRRKNTRQTRNTRARPIVLDPDSEDEEAGDETGASDYASATASAHSSTAATHGDDEGLADENGMRFSDLIAGRINNDIDSEGGDPSHGHW